MRRPSPLTFGFLPATLRLPCWSRPSALPPALRVGGIDGADSWRSATLLEDPRIVPEAVSEVQELPHPIFDGAAGASPIFGDAIFRGDFRPARALEACLVDVEAGADCVVANVEPAPEGRKIVEVAPAPEKRGFRRSAPILPEGSPSMRVANPLQRAVSATEDSIF